MLNSKRLKDRPPTGEFSWLYKWYLDSKLVDRFLKIKRKIIDRPIFQIGRLWAWYWNVFRYDVDFDAHCLDRIIWYKLKRVEKVLQNGHAEQEPKDMKALRLAIKLAKRLADEDYLSFCLIRHEAKWGELYFGECVGESIDANDFFLRKNAKTPEEKEQERKEFSRAARASDAMQERERKWLHGILLKYQRVWWD